MGLVTADGWGGLFGRGKGKDKEPLILLKYSKRGVRACVHTHSPSTRALKQMISVHCCSTGAKFSHTQLSYAPIVVQHKVELESNIHYACGTLRCDCYTRFWFVYSGLFLTDSTNSLATPTGVALGHLRGCGGSGALLRQQGSCAQASGSILGRNTCICGLRARGHYPSSHGASRPAGEFLLTQFTDYYYSTFDADRSQLASLYVGSC